MRLSELTALAEMKVCVGGLSPDARVAAARSKTVAVEVEHSNGDADRRKVWGACCGDM